MNSLHKDVSSKAIAIVENLGSSERVFKKGLHEEQNGTTETFGQGSLEIIRESGVMIDTSPYDDGPVAYGSLEIKSNGKLVFEQRGDVVYTFKPGAWEKALKTLNELAVKEAALSDLRKNFRDAVSKKPAAKNQPPAGPEPSGL